MGNGVTLPTNISFLKNRLEKITNSEKNINNIKNKKFDESFFIFFTFLYLVLI